MLANLKIENIALIDKLEIELFNGFNVLTGETGAGKSIIIDSLNFVLGARSDKSLIKTGENTALVEALFNDCDNDKFKKIFDDFGLSFDGQILISRKMSKDGKNEVRVNGHIITVSMLKEITGLLVDIYGQQEQVGLLKPKSQLELLDRYIGKDIRSLQNQYENKLVELNEINEKLNSFGGDKESLLRERDYLTFVVDEIEKFKVSSSEEEDLINKKNRMNNIEKISSALVEIDNNLSQGISCVNSSNRAFNVVSSYDSELSKLQERLESASIEIDDILSEVNRLQSETNFDEDEFEKIDNRLDAYKALKRKYGGSIESIIETLDKSKERLKNIEDSENIVKGLTSEKLKLLSEIYSICKDMNNLRISYSKQMSEKLLENLKVLGMPSASLSFNISMREESEENLFYSGLNDVEMMFNANLGEELKPLNKVVSGGELSRLMLAIKAVVSESDDMPTMIFDEIDSGISGKMSEIVSYKMAEISKFHQVIVITHSAHIAAMGDNNYFVQKVEKDGKTISNVKLLSNEEKIDEIARFMSTEATFSDSRELAKKLILEQTKYKQSL